MRIAALVTAINVLVAGGFSIAGLVSPGSILPASYVLAIYKRSESALPILGTLAGFIRLLDGVVGLRQHDLWKSIGPLVIAALQFAAMYLFGRSARGRAE
jgi:hypothetical protein